MRSNFLLGVLFTVGLSNPAVSQVPTDDVPGEALFSMGWSGTHAVGEAYRATGFGKLMTDPSIRRLSAAVRRGLEMVLQKEMDSDGRDALEVLRTSAPILVRKPVTLSLLDLGVRDGTPYLELVLTVRAGDEASVLNEAIGRIAARGELADGGSLSVGDVAFTRFAIPDTPLSLVAGVVDKHFVLAVGDDAARKTIAMIRGDGGASLSRNATFVEGRGKVAAPGGSTVLYGYLDTPRCLERILTLVKDLGKPIPQAVRDVLEATGISRVGTVSLDYGLNEAGFREALFVEVTGGVTPGRPISDDDLLQVPRDSTYFSLCSVDLGWWFGQCRRWVAKIDEGASQQFEHYVGSAEEMLGVKIQEELLPAFGKRFLVYEDPSLRGLIPGLVLSVEGANREILTRCFDKLVPLAQQLAAQKSVVVEVRTMQRHDSEISFLHVAGVPSPVAPAWIWRGDRLDCAINPAGIEHVLLRRAAGGGREGSILANADFKRVRQRIPAGASAVEYSNIGDGIARFYPLAMQLCQMALSMGVHIGIDADASMLPSPAIVEARLFGQITASQGRDDGFLAVFHGPLPISLGGMPLGGLGSVGTIATVAALLLPMVAGARQRTEQTVNLHNLKELCTLSILYSDHHKGYFPKDLDAIRTYYEGEGVSPEIFQSFFDPTVEFVLIAGQRNTFPATNVLIYDPTPSPDGKMAVGFVGMDVHMLPAAEAWRQIEATKAWLKEHQ